MTTRHVYSAPEDIPGLLARLTPRDRLLIDLLGRHSVLTIDQIHLLYFRSLRTTRYRIATLLEYGVLSRFRALVRPGSQAFRYTLGFAGALLHAAAIDQPLPRPPAWNERLTRLAASPKLPHLLGVNDFFCRILATARDSGDVDLTEWRSEAETGEITGGMVRPDAAATVNIRGGSCAFWFEHDTGTETLARLVTKVDRYCNHLAGSGRAICFELPSAAREANFHAALAGQRRPLLIATTVTSRAADPTGSVWRRPGQPGLWRLTDLAAGR